MRMLLLWLVLVCLLPGVLGSAALFVYQYRVSRAKLESDALQTTRVLSQLVDSDLAKVQAVAQALAGARELALRDLGGFHRHASDLLQGLSIGSNIALSDANGQQLLNTLRPFGDPLPVSRNAELIRQLFASGKPFVSNLVVSKVTGSAIIAVYVPVFLDGKVAYAVGIGIAPQQLSQILLDQRLPPERIVAILDGSGVIVARNLATERFVGRKATPEFLAATQSTMEGAFETNTLEGIPVFTSYSRSQRTRWTVAMAITRQDLEAPLLRSALVFGAGIAVLFGIGSALAWSTGGRIARSVKVLTGPAAALEAGDPIVVPKIHFREAAEVLLSMAKSASVLRQRTARLMQTAQALKLSDARLRGIFDSATDAIITADETQTVVMANPAAANMFRHALDQLVGMPLERLLPERFQQQHRKDVAAFGENEVVARHMGRARDVMGLRADGSEFPMDAAISHLQLGGRRLYTVILRDISERRRAEQALLASRNKLEAALASMSDGVVISDAQGRLIEFNDAFAFFHRFANKEHCPNSLAEYSGILEMFMADGQAAPLDQWAIARALRDETGTNVEYRLRRKDTGESWIGSYSFAPIHSESGAVVGSVVVCRDITALKQVQEELATSHADLQRLVTEMDSVQENERKRIARELHDDLQQTLGAIMMHVTAAAEQMRVAPADAYAALSEIEALANAALVSTRRMVGDLRPMVLEDLGLVDALQAMASQFEQRTGIDCDFEPEDGMDALLAASPAVSACLYRVAQESLNNVMKHAQASTVEIKLQGLGDERVALRITDNGKGIQSGERSKPRSFGLVGMRERLRAVAGELRVESTPGDGTTVEARVPLERADRRDRPDGSCGLPG
jgi:PAS domain S-box-containing protein